MKNAILFLLGMTLPFIVYAKNEKKYVAVSTLGEMAVIDGQDHEKFWARAISDSLTIDIITPSILTASDYKVIFKAAYDYNNLYCIAYVTDDRMITWLDTNMAAWQADCIELFFNPYVNDPSRQLEECHFLVGINNREYPEIFSGQLFNYPEIQGYFDEYQYYTFKTKNGYMLEMQLPWDIIIDRLDYLAPEIAPGTRIPWDINGCDADNPVVMRDLISGWNADWDKDWIDNSRYGILELGDDNPNGFKMRDQYEVRMFSSSFNIFNLMVNSPVRSSTPIEIYNLGGKLILKQSIKNGTTTINLTNQSAGIYILSATINGNTFRQKIVVK